MHWSDPRQQSLGDITCNARAALQDAVVAKQYMRQNKEFQRQAKEWTQTYAVKPSTSDSRVSTCFLMIQWHGT